MKRNKDSYVKTIDGGRSKYRNCIGYCNSCLHKGYVTRNIEYKHKCLERNCSSFQPIQNSSYWKNKRKKSERKQEINNNRKKIKETENLIRQIVSEHMPIVLCKHLYDSTYLVVTNETLEISFSFLCEEQNINIYSIAISPKKNTNIVYNYLSFLPSQMRDKAIKYKNDRRGHIT